MNEAVETLNSRRPVSGVGADVVGYPTGTSINTPDSLPRDYSFYAVVVDAGPSGDADFTDQRYWVRSVAFGQAAGASPTDVVSAYVDWSAHSLWLVASHIAEMSAGSHALNVTTSPTDLTIPLSAQATLVKVKRAQCGGWILETIQSPALLVRITAHTAGIVEWGPYTAESLDGAKNYSIYNGFEPCDGSPGSLGVSVSAIDGSVNGGSCIVQPIGDGAIVPIFWNSNDDRWTFSAPNSAQ